MEAEPEVAARLQVADADQTRALCEELVACFTMILDPLCPQAERAVYDQKVEDFKEHSPYCLQCGFVLAREQDSRVRCLGLQLIEHFVKYRWNSMQPADREAFRLELLNFMRVSVFPSDQESNYVKEGWAKITVETAKRMWPQIWESFLDDLNQLTLIGPTQVELVLLIFRRLAEDTHEYYECAGLTSQRRREMTVALMDDVETIFTFLVHNLKNPPSQHLLPVVLSTVTVFAEWVEFSVLLMKDCTLLVLLYGFINVEELKTAACECLAVILSRKSDVKRTAEERMKLLILLTTEALTAILEASVKAHAMGVVEEQYIFLKRVCQVLVHLGVSQLAPLWSSAKFPRPEGFELYLQAVLEFTTHSSQLLCHTSLEVWTHFISHNYIKEDPVFKAFLPRVLTVVRSRLTRLGDPELSNDISCEYSQIDFDGVHEYAYFFSRYRNIIVRLISNLVRAIPRIAAKEALEALQSLTQQQPFEEGCSPVSLLYLEWDGFARYLELWTGHLMSERNAMAVVKETGLAVVHKLLGYQTQDPLIVGCLFRCLATGITEFFKFDPQALQACLEKIFTSIRLFGNITEQEKPAVKKRMIQARNLIASCFVHLCFSQGKLLKPIVRKLYEQYRTLSQTVTLLHGEKSYFVEAFIILGQQKGSAEEQTAYLGEILRDVSSLARELMSAVASVQGFVQFFGLNLNPEDPNYDRERKRQLNHVIYVITATLKRTGTVDRDARLLPSYKHVVPILADIVIPLINILYLLWSEKSKPLFSSYFQDIREFSLSEKADILGRMANPQAENDAGEIALVQMNLSSIHDQSLRCISRAMKVYGVKHLQEIGFMDRAIQAVFENAEELNNWKMRALLRSFVVTVVKDCPEEEWGPVHLQILYRAGRMIFNRLTTDWTTILQTQSILESDSSFAEDKGQGEEEVSQEVLQEQLTIVLSREYAALLEMVCMRKEEHHGTKRPRGLRGVPEEDIAMEGEMQDTMVTVDVDQQEGKSAPIERWSLFCSLSSLAHRLLQEKAMCELLFLSAFSGLGWNDTYTAGKCCNVAGLLFETVPVGGFSADVYEHLFTQVLMGLQRHGTDDHTKTQLSLLALMIYQATMKQYPRMQEILVQLPGNSHEGVQAFNKILETTKPVSLRTKRAKFKELLAGIVGKYIGEAFKKPIVFDPPEKKKAKYIPSLSISALFQADVNFSL